MSITQETSQAINSYLGALQKLSKNESHKQYNSVKKSAQDAIIKEMISRKLECIPHQGVFIVLKQRTKQVSLSDELLVKIYYQFTSGNAEQLKTQSLQAVAQNFPKFVKEVRHKLGEKSFSIEVRKTQPMTDLINEFFQKM